MAEKKVLIVDDVAYVRKALAEILSAAGYEVVGEATTGTEAVEQFMRKKPDLVTMDLIMPKVGGIEATRRIVKLEKEAIVIAVTAMNQEHLIMEAINAGARDYIVKPFRKRELLITLEYALDGLEASKRTKSFEA